MTDRIWLSSYPAGVPADIDAGQYPSLVALMEEAFSKYADRVAYSFMGKEITYAQTDSLSKAFAAYLQGLGLARGDWIQGVLSGIALAMAMLPEEFPMALAIFLALGAHMQWIALVVESYRVFPPGDTWLGPEKFSDIAGFATMMFITAVAIALPVTLVLLVVQVVTGVLSRSAPALNLFALGLPAGMTLDAATARERASVTAITDDALPGWVRSYRPVDHRRAHRLHELVQARQVPVDVGALQRGRRQAPLERVRDQRAGVRDRDQQRRRAPGQCEDVLLHA